MNNTPCVAVAVAGGGAAACTITNTLIPGVSQPTVDYNLTGDCYHHHGHPQR